MTLTELAAQVIVTVVNLSVLKNDRARAIRFSTLTAICEALDCDVGDVIVVKSDSTAVDDVTVGMVCDFSRRVGRPRGTGPAAA